MSAFGCIYNIFLKMFFNINIWFYIMTKWFSNRKSHTNFPKCNFSFRNCNASFLKSYLQIFLFSLFQFDSRYSYLKSIQTADTRSLLRADTSVLILMPLYRETKNRNSLYKYTVLADTNVADTVTPSRLTGSGLFK